MTYDLSPYDLFVQPLIDHWVDYNEWPWAVWNNPIKLVHEHPSFMIGEFGFIALTMLSFLHGFGFLDDRASEKSSKKSKSHSKNQASSRVSRRLLFVASFLVGGLNDYFFMLLPIVDNFFQAQAIIMLTPRMPLYILCIYNAFLYWPILAVEYIYGENSSPTHNYKEINTSIEYRDEPLTAECRDESKSTTCDETSGKTNETNGKTSSSSEKASQSNEKTKTKTVRKCWLEYVGEASVGGLLGMMMYIPYDIVGARHLWWTWHHDDAPIKIRWLGVPAGSTLFCVFLPFSMCLLWRLSTGKIGKGKCAGQYRSSLNILTFLMAFSTLLMVVCINIATVFATPISSPGIPTIRSVFLSVLCLLMLAVRGYTKGKRRTGVVPKKYSGICCKIFPLYFLTFFAIQFFFDPEKVISTGVHQFFGDCNVKDIDLFGDERLRYVCEKNHPDFYFGLDCGKSAFETTGSVPTRWDFVDPRRKVLKKGVNNLTMKGSDSEVVQWYTVCGKPHELYPLWVLAEGFFCLIGTVAFLWAFGWFETAKKLTPNAIIKGIIDSTVTPLVHLNMHFAVYCLYALAVGTMFLFGELWNISMEFLTKEILPRYLFTSDYEGLRSNDEFQALLGYYVFERGTVLQQPYEYFRYNFLGESVANHPAALCILNGKVYLSLIGFYTALDALRPGRKSFYMFQPRKALDWGLGWFRTVTQQLYSFIPVTIMFTFGFGYLRGPLFYRYPFNAEGYDDIRIHCFRDCELPDGTSDVNIPHLAPSLFEFVVHILYSLLVHDLTYFFFHWSLHRNFTLYNRIHKVHHEYTAPFSTVGAHLHPYESTFTVVQNLIPVYCGYLHPFTGWIATMIGTFAGVEAHSGYYFNPLTMFAQGLSQLTGRICGLTTGFLFGGDDYGFAIGKDIARCGWGGTGHHDMHHKRPWTNFQPYFGYLDLMCGSYWIDPVTQKASEKTKGTDCGTEFTKNDKGFEGTECYDKSQHVTTQEEVNFRKNL